MSLSIRVVAVGPGSRKYISQAAWDAIKEARVLVGGQRLLEEFAGSEQRQYRLDGDLSGALQFIRRESYDGKVAVLVSGDTGIFSFADYLKRHLELDVEMEFIPGISSFQLLFARIGRSWQGASFRSVHGRLPENLSRKVLEERMTVLFTGKPWYPQEVARYLLEEGVPDMKVVLGKDLSYPEEEILWSTLEGLASCYKEWENKWENSILVIFNE